MSRLDELTAVLKKKHVFIQTHDYPDQDALACAGGLQTLLSGRGIDSDICYRGQIDKANMLRCVELLNIELHPIEKINMSPEDEIILVDCQKGNTNVKDFIGNEAACIDHHSMQNTEPYRFFDIRSEVGACSSIIASYFLENQIEVSHLMATALAYGIQIDTAGLTRGISELDIDMFCYLMKKADPDILNRLNNCNLNMRDLEAYKRAISDLRVYGRIGLAGVGADCSDALVGTIADFLLSMEEVGFALVHSYRNGGLKFSARSEYPELDAAFIIRNILKGYGDGGGHAVMAAGFVPHVTLRESEHTAHLIEDRLLELLL